MKTINITGKDTKLTSLLQEIQKNKEKFIICQNGQPIADLFPHKKNRRIDPHPVMSKIKIDYNPTEPLSKDEWPEED